MMEAMTKSWTDERLEERFDAIDQRFDAVDQRFDRVEGELRDLRLDMKAGFERVDERFEKMNTEIKVGFGRVDERFEAMHRLMVQGGVVIIAALLGLIGTQL
jgi:chromosome segregation ATPase